MIKCVSDNRFSFFAAGCACLIALGFVSQSSAVERPSLLTDGDARRAGLEIAWTSQIAVDSSRGGISNVVQQVGPKKKWVSYEVKFENNVDVFSERDRDRSGVRLGRSGAKKKADKYLANMLDLGYEATMETKSHDIPPEVYVYALTTNGKIHCFSGETGETLWTARHGRRDVPAWIQADRGYLALVSGTEIFCLDGYSGKLLWSKESTGVPAAQPAITREYVFVPMVSGTIEDYHIRDPRVYSESIRSPGHIYVGALATQNRIAWVTDRAHLNVAFGNREARGRGIDFRLRMQSVVVAPPTSLEVVEEGKVTYDNILTANLDGYVHCVDSRNGSIRWVFPTGGSIRHSPVAFGTEVFVTTTEKLLFAVDSGSGLEIWRTPNVKKVFGASKTRLYCIDSTNNFSVLDRGTGYRVTSLPIGTTGFHMHNMKTDRIFIGSKHGGLQCLHEIGADAPLFHRAINELEVVKERKPRKRGEQSGSKTEDINPFGAGSDDDPFGAGAGGGMDDDDPFGAGGGGMDDDDPFGAGSSDSKPADDDDDPFG